MSSYSSRIVELKDIEELLDFEASQLAQAIPDESERMFAQWNSRARNEALEHYLQLGWSFLIRDPSKPSKWSPEGQLLGYFLGQPLLFFEGQTQSLWIEHICTRQKDVRNELCELAYRLSREKHFQRVYLPNHPEDRDFLQIFKVEAWSPEVLMLKTTKVG